MLKTGIIGSVLLVVVVGFMVLSCSNDETSVTTGDQFTTIHGTVFDSITGSLIESTAVYLGEISNGTEFYSDSLGEYKVLLLGYGTKKIIAVKTGYSTKELVVTVSASDTSSTDILIIPVVTF